MDNCIEEQIETSQDMDQGGVDCQIDPKTKTKEAYRKYLKYSFSEEEKKEMAAEIARNVSVRDQAESELKNIKAQFDAKKKQAEAAISDLAEKINSGYEYRDTPCEIRKDFTLGLVTTIRLDTFDVVEHRKMTVADRQMSI